MSYREYFDIDPEYFPQVDKKIIEEQKTVYIHIYYVMQVRHGKKEKSTSLPYDTH